MPLSDNEQRLLSEMEQRLLDDDPRFASTMRGSSIGIRSKQRLIVGAGTVIAGLLIMLASLYNQLIPVAVVGFVVMLGGASWALSGPRKAAGPEGVVTPEGKVKKRHSTPKAGSPGFMQRMENRWERRRREGDS